MDLKEYLSNVALKVGFEADEFAGAVDTKLQKASAHLLLGGGKRLRPALAMLCADAIRPGASEEILSGAFALEWFHTFTLVHDDIMDGDSLRRGRPTVHTEWSVPTAILAGDVLCSKAYEYICRAPNASAEAKVKAVAMLAHTCCELCEGQQEDIDFESRSDVSFDEYLGMVKRKTGILYAAAAGIGAILAGGDMKSVSALYTLGLNAGIAFQIRDDIIDLTATTEVLGKNRCSDLRENKQTAVAILAREKGIDLSVYNKPELSDDEISEAVELLTSSGVIDEAWNIARKLIADAKAGLSVLEESEYKSMILEMADYFAEREF